MQKLAAHGLLVGQRGAGGGYALARPVSEISLADIVEAVEGPIVLTMCADGVNHECVLDAHCKVKPHMSIVGDAIRSSLRAVSLAQLCSPAKTGVQERDSAAAAAPWAPAFAGERVTR
jgi:Rrf2 family protein